MVTRLDRLPDPRSFLYTSAATRRLPEIGRSYNSYSSWRSPPKQGLPFSEAFSHPIF
jgi:hypothetical protein